MKLPKTYRYSDVGFILLRLLVEKTAGMPMDAYLQRELYEPMGLERTGYLPFASLSEIGSRTFFCRPFLA